MIIQSSDLVPRPPPFPKEDFVLIKSVEVSFGCILRPPEKKGELKGDFDNNLV
jgi:hypothetical protein